MHQLCIAPCSPEGMIRSVQSCPGASSLADLKDCLDFCSNSWVSLFCRQGGAALLLQARALSLVQLCWYRTMYCR